MNTKNLYFIKHFALLALFAMGFLLVPSVGTASAQKGVRREVATTDMISRALDFRSATDLAVYAENGVSDKGNSVIKGEVLGLTRDSQDAKSIESRRDFGNAFSAINQLPCTEISDTDLGGKTYGPGVYCMSSAQLAG
jgi:hypothetical protein